MCDVAGARARDGDDQDDDEHTHTRIQTDDAHEDGHGDDGDDIDVDSALALVDVLTEHGRDADAVALLRDWTPSASDDVVADLRLFAELKSARLPWIAAARRALDRPTRGHAYLRATARGMASDKHAPSARSLAPLTTSPPPPTAPVPDGTSGDRGHGTRLATQESVLWQTITSELAATSTPAAFAQWFAPLCLSAVRDSPDAPLTLVVTAPDDHIRSYVAHHLVGRIIREARSALHLPLEREIVIDCVVGS